MVWANSYSNFFWRLSQQKSTTLIVACLKWNCISNGFHHLPDFGKKVFDSGSALDLTSFEKTYFGSQFYFFVQNPTVSFCKLPPNLCAECFWKLVNGFYFCAKRKFFFLCGLTNRSLRNNEWKKEAGQKQNREHNRKVTWTNFRKTVAYEQQNISSKSFGQRSQKGFFDSSSFWKITGNFFFHFSFSPILFSWEDCY